MFTIEKTHLKKRPFFKPDLLIYTLGIKVGKIVE